MYDERKECDKSKTKTKKNLLGTSLGSRPGLGHAKIVERTDAGIRHPNRRAKERDFVIV